MIILFSMLKRVKYYMYMATSLLVTDMVLYYIYDCGVDPERQMKLMAVGPLVGDKLWYFLCTERKANEDFLRV